MALRTTVQPGAESTTDLARKSALDAVHRQLRQVGGIPERTIDVTVPGSGTLVIVHNLGRTPKGIAVERCDLGGPITLSARGPTTMTLANAGADDAVARVRVY